MNLKLRKGKKRKVVQWKCILFYFYCNYIVRQAIKPQLLVGLFSFKPPLAAGWLPILIPKFVVFTDPFLSVLGMYNVSSDQWCSFFLQWRHVKDISHIIIPAYLPNCSVNWTGLNTVIGLIWVRKSHTKNMHRAVFNSIQFLNTIKFNF